MRRGVEDAKLRSPRQRELAASSLDAQFAFLEDLGEQAEVEARLAILKAMDRQAIDRL
jgi:phage shock protein A